MTRRRPLLGLLATVLIAPRAFAHGEHLATVFGIVFYVIPGGGLLLVGWHRLWARVLSVLVLGNCAYFFWFRVLPVVNLSGASPLTQWLAFLSPTLSAVLVAVVLRLAVKRPALAVRTSDNSRAGRQ